MASLATIGSAELKKMSVREFTVCLGEMPADAIARFSRMRKLRPEHVEALDKFLKANPDKRVKADGSVISSGKKSDKPKTVKKPASPKKKAVKKKPAPAKKRAIKPPAKAVKAPPRDDNYVPLAVRLEAWWKGVDVEVVRSGISSKRAKTLQKTPNKVVVAATPKTIDPFYRLEVTRRLWGKQFTLPGGLPYSSAMLKPLGLKAGMSFLDLSAGLGGSARMLSKKYELETTALEPDPTLAKLSEEFADDDSGSNLTVSHYAPNKLSLPPSHFDAAISREALFSVDDKKTFLEQVAQALKPDGSFVFTDYALTDRNREPEALVKWRDSETVPPRPWTLDEYRQNLSDLKFDVRAFDDKTAEYLTLIHAGWKKLMQSLEEDKKVGSDLVDALMNEASVWHARYEALDSGRLKLLKVQAAMRRGPIRSLNDAMRI